MEFPSSSEDSSKLYVGSVTDDMSEEEIRDYFATKFGEVKNLVLLKDRITGKRRGYGFVEFSDPGPAEEALKEEEHVIAGKKVTVNKARRRDQHRRNYQSVQQQHPIPDRDVNIGLNNTSNVCSNNGNPTQLKIFVGGISSTTNEDDFKSYFKDFGKITDAVLMYDRETSRPRGFGFVTFDSEDAVKKVMRNNFHELKNKKVEVKLAVPREGNKNSLVVHRSDSDGKRGKDHVDDNESFYYLEYIPRYAWQNHIPFYPPAPHFYCGTGSYGGGYAFGGYPRIPYYGSELISQSTMTNADMYTSYSNPGINGYMASSGGYGYHGVPDNDTLIQSLDNLQLTEDNVETADVESANLNSQQTS